MAHERGLWVLSSQGKTVPHFLWTPATGSGVHTTGRIYKKDSQVSLDAPAPSVPLLGKGLGKNPPQTERKTSPEWDGGGGPTGIL